MPVPSGRVPNEDPSGQTLVLPRGQFYRIMQSARVLTEAEKEAEYARIKEEKMATIVRVLCL